jgi:hypothetical protein
MQFFCFKSLKKIKQKIKMQRSAIFLKELKVGNRNNPNNGFVLYFTNWVSDDQIMTRSLFQKIFRPVMHRGIHSKIPNFKKIILLTLVIELLTMF